MEQIYKTLADNLATAATLDAAKDQRIIDLQTQVEAQKNVSVFDGLELTPWLVAPGTTANTATTGSTMTPSQAQPGVNSAWLGINPNGPWADVYFYKTPGVDLKKTSFIYELSLLFGSAADAAASNCVELDIMKVVGHVPFNPGLQFNFGSNLLRVWNRNQKEWVTAGLLCPRWTANQWTRIVFEAHHDATTVYHDAVTINGKRNVLNLNFPIPPSPLNWADICNVGLQLDGDKKGTAYKLYHDRVRFTAS